MTDKEIAYLCAVATNPQMFLHQCFRTVYPHNRFLNNWHIDAILHSLELTTRGDRPRSMINLPPRYFKSFIVSVVWPAFAMAHDPAIKIICTSYSEELAKKIARDFKSIVTSQWYRRLFPQVVLRKITAVEVTTSVGGFRFAVSVGGSLTGRGADLIVVDDPIKPEDALSEKHRNAQNEWYKTTLLSRLDDKKLGAMIIVMQRLHINDLTGFLEQTDEYHKLSLPAIALKDESIPISATKNHVRLAGTALHELHEDLPTLAKIKNAISPLLFSAQYQQSPQTPEGSLIKAKYLKVIKQVPPYPGTWHWWLSVDAAASTSENADYSTITLGVSHARGHFVRFVERGRWNFEDLARKVMGYLGKYPGLLPIVEKASAGISLIEYLRKREIFVVEAVPRHDKTARLSFVLSTFALGRVFIVDPTGGSPWITPFMDELMVFPNGRHDDQVDSLVHAITALNPRVDADARAIGIFPYESPELSPA